MRGRLSYANVMATVAVFIALGGSSYAAVKITGKDVKNGSLTGLDIKDESLRGHEIRTGAISTDDVKDRSLLAKDFAPGQLAAGAKGAKGDRGATGPAGAKGEPGEDGTDGTANGAAMIARMNAIPATFDQEVTFGSPSGTSVAATDENSVSMVSPGIAVTASDLAVSLTVFVNNNSARRFTLRVNGADTALSCTMGSFGTACASSATVTVPPASLLSIKSDRPAVFNAAGTEARIAFQLRG